MAASVDERWDKGSADRRAHDRRPFAGAEIFIFLDTRLRHRMRLRDLSILGLSGLSDAPLIVGQTVIVQLEELLLPAAEVTWTRLSLAGLNFINPLASAKLQRLYDRHEAGARWSPAMRAAPAAHGWWEGPGEAA